jgi:membrane-associated protease RseP (regulator of RpoE activity)
MDEHTQDRKVYEPDAIIPPVSGGYVYFKPPPPPRRWINYVLFAVTFVTTLLAGAGQEGVTLQTLAASPLSIFRGLPFSLTLMGILLAHEMGHFIMARRHGVDATLPYFIPAPFGIGTFGAVIKMRSPLRSRNALIDIGAAGPIAGMIVAIPASYIGLVLSDVKPITDAMTGGITLGDSLLFKGMQYLIHGPLKPGYDVFLHPVAFAGWIGMLVTMLNLLPVGQLDGGHVSYAVFGPNAIWVSRIVFLVIVLLSIFSWFGWITWALLMLLVIRLRHPPIYETVPTRLDRGRTVVAFVTLVLFVLTFMPSPMSGM